MELNSDNATITPQITASSSQDSTTIVPVPMPPVQVADQKRRALPEMRFDTPEAARVAAAEAVRSLHASMVPVSVGSDGTIRINEAAMLSEREYTVRVGDDIYQFVKRDDGVVVMYELR